MSCVGLGYQKSSRAHICASSGPASWHIHQFCTYTNPQRAKHVIVLLLSGDFTQSQQFLHATVMSLFSSRLLASTAQTTSPGPTGQPGCTFASSHLSPVPFVTYATPSASAHLNYNNKDKESRNLLHCQHHFMSVPAAQSDVNKEPLFMLGDALRIPRDRQC